MIKELFPILTNLKTTMTICHQQKIIPILILWPTVFGKCSSRDVFARSDWAPASYFSLSLNVRSEKLALVWKIKTNTPSFLLEPQRNSREGASDTKDFLLTIDFSCSEAFTAIDSWCLDGSQALHHRFHP